MAMPAVNMARLKGLGGWTMMSSLDFRVKVNQTPGLNITNGDAPSGSVLGMVLGSITLALGMGSASRAIMLASGMGLVSAALTLASGVDMVLEAATLASGMGMVLEAALLVSGMSMALEATPSVSGMGTSGRLLSVLGHVHPTYRL